MAYINKVIILGNVGRAPETRTLTNGEAVANITVATTDKWKDKNSGKAMEVTEWHRVTFFGRLAEIAGKYLHKGSSVYIEGKIKTRKYTDKEGVDKYSTEIHAYEMKMLDGKPEQGQQASAPRPAAPTPRPQAPRQASSGFEDIDDDLIPF